MKSTISTCLLFAGIGAAQEFEGVVNMKMHAGAEPMNIAYQIKGQRTRMEMNGPQGQAVMLMDMTTGSMTTLAQKRLPSLRRIWISYDAVAPTCRARLRGNALAPLNRRSIGQEIAKGAPRVR